MNIRQILPGNRIIQVLTILLFTVLAVSFILRGFILRKALDAVNARMKRHSYSVHWDGARFTGVNSVFVKGIYFQSKKSNDELFLDSVSVKVRILPLFFKNIRIRDFQCRTISIRYHAEKKAFTKPVATSGKHDSFMDDLKNLDLADLANKNIRRLFNYAPSKAKINRVQVRISSSADPTVIGIHGFSLSKGSFSARLILAGYQSRAEIPIDGRFDKSASVLELNVTRNDTSLLPIPLLREKYGVSTGFDSLALNLNLANRHRHQVDLEGNFSFSGFVLNGERLSTSDIKVDHFNSSFLVHLGSDYLEFDSTTQVFLNRIKIVPYLKFSFAGDPEISFRLLPVSWDAGDFFSSLPQGMFTSLTGLRAKGTLHYFLDFSVNLMNPDSLLFNTRLHADDFSILSYGTDDYTDLNGQFYHRVYERGKLAAAFQVGGDNPDFIPFGSISPFLRAAVMTSEDGSFFYHHGFNANAFRESMVTNIKEKRFARGGSTISMQLVKNVFLTRNKTLARKIEEAIIVWLIESNSLVSKQRMYEVYLNIIEWGPGIYGINQASHFYFSKPPAELSLAESVFLASIVPRPKWYKYSFESNGILRSYYLNYFDRLKELMVRKEFIAPSDTIGVNPMIQLTGPASQIFTVTDTSSVDSVRLDVLKILPLR